MLKRKKTVAVLDDDNRLVGTKRIVRPSADHVVVDDGIDLPMDGTYRWVEEEGCFFHEDHGHGRPKAPPVADTVVLHCLAKGVEDPPEDLSAWMKSHEESQGA